MKDIICVQEYPEDGDQAIVIFVNLDACSQNYQAGIDHETIGDLVWRQ